MIEKRGRTYRASYSGALQNIMWIEHEHRGRAETDVDLVKRRDLRRTRPVYIQYAH